jgi:hypothetical protein
MKIIFFKLFNIYLFIFIVTLFSVQSIYGSLIDTEDNTLILKEYSLGKYEVIRNKRHIKSVSYKDIANYFRKLNYFDFSIHFPNPSNFYLADAYIDGWIIPTHIPVIILLFNIDFVFDNFIPSLMLATPQFIYSYLKYHKTRELLTGDPTRNHHEIGMFLSVCTAISPILGAAVECFLRNVNKDKLLSSHEYKVLDFGSAVNKIKYD